MKVKFTNTQMSILANLYFEHEHRSVWGPHIPQDEDYKELKILCNHMLKVRDEKLKQGKDVLNQSMLTRRPPSCTYNNVYSILQN